MRRVQTYIILALGIHHQLLRRVQHRHGIGPALSGLVRILGKAVHPYVSGTFFPYSHGSKIAWDNRERGGFVKMDLPLPKPKMHHRVVVLVPGMALERVLPSGLQITHGWSERRSQWR
jgi:hypothetical protein